MTKMLSRMLVCLLMIAGVAHARTESRQLILDPAGGSAPGIAVLAAEETSLILEMRLPALEIEDLSIEGESYQVLSMAGGELRGNDGAPGLPFITRLVAVPPYVGVTARVTASETRTLPGFLPAPVQPGEPGALALDRAAYGAAAPSLAPAPVEVGAPAILRDLRVVPITFSPVAWDPATGALTVNTRLEVELSFAGSDMRNAAATQRRLIPESFDALYRSTVLNYDQIMDREDVAVGPGTWLIITPGTSVHDELLPLVDWRKRQGFNVIQVTTGETGSSNVSIKNYIQNVYNTVDPPLEYVVLAGDANGTYPVACWFENVSGYNGEGDHYYSNLEGGDILADVHVGRLSYRTDTNLAAIVNKIVTYETNPPVTDAGWFTRAGLTGDASDSGITCIWVNQWVKTQLQKAGYAQIDTIWGGNFPNLMSATINSGETIFGYRGYLGMSGFTTGYIDGLSNGYELPFAVVPTCGSGSFSDDNHAPSEAFLRNAGGGGIGAVGTSTWGTHTRYNNCYFTGAMEGAINGSSHTLGFAHTRGKLNLYQNYALESLGIVETWSMWNNLMGDPATRIWMHLPATLSVDYKSQLPVGANSVLVTVTSGLLPTEGALVAIYKAGTFSASGYTDYQGQINLPIPDGVTGSVLVTVTKYNCRPHLGTCTLGAVSVYPAYEAHTVDDDMSGGSSGNGNAIANPAETIEMPVALRNLGTSAAASVTATLETTDAYVTVIDGAETYGTINAGQVVWSAEDFDLQLTPNAPDGHVIALDLIAHSGASNYPSLIELTVQSAAFELQSYAWGGGGGTLDPGESGTLSVTIRNTGSISGATVMGALASDDPFIAITDAAGSFGTVAVGATAANTGNPFALSVDSGCFEGHQAQLTLTLTFNGQAQDAIEVTLPVGTKSSNDPLGPDAYGYYAFDNTDTSYPYAPTYSWVEIDPNYGGVGTDVGLSDFGWEQDDTEIKTLPFTFRYYGQDYTRVSICSNGWVAMGTTYLKPYHNQSLPGTGSPDAVICAFWDNLYQSGTRRVYHWNDAANHRYVIQWSRMYNDYNGAVENFEMVLYDPAFHPTSTGDGEILFQYHTVNNTDDRDAYATVGMQNQDHTTGLLYHYWGSAMSGAATLVAGRAIRILPLAGSLVTGLLEGDVTNASNGGTPVAGVTVRVLEANQALVSGGDGHYAGNVPEGSYTVRAEHSSFAPVTVTGVDIVEDQVTTLDFALIDVQGPQISGTTQLPHTSDPVGPYIVETTITDFSAMPERHCFYKVNGGGHYEAPLTLIDPGTGLYRAEIPGYPVNTLISYWLEAEDAAGNASRDPEGSDTYDFYVLSAIVLLADDMEADHGWTVGDTGDNATSGIWTRVDPNGVFYGGTPVQPEDDATPPPGVMCFITGNDPVGSNQGTDDVDGGKTTLLSPWFDLTDAFAVNLSYRRWYTNDTGSNPGEDFWRAQVTDDGGATWIDLESTTASDRSWSLHSFALGGMIDFTDQVRFRFIAEDAGGGGSVVEAGVDEFQLTGLAQAEPTAAGEAAVPARVTLLPNQPNPFNPETAIRFGLPAAGTISLRVYDASGRLVRTLADGEHFSEGFHELRWNGRNDGMQAVGSGIYFYVLDALGNRHSGKMTLLK